MEITAFGKTLPLTQHLNELVFQRRDTLDPDLANLITAALATIRCHQDWLAQADAREARLMERLDQIEKALATRERCWLVWGQVHYTPYMNKPQQWADIRRVNAPTREEAERLFVEHWDNKSEDHGDSYWVTVTNCQEELG
jgi:hypothetical protein